jgi:HEAT repeat protein
VAGRVEQYRAELRQRGDWELFLGAHSGLPGPRANLELAQAAGDEASKTVLLDWADSDDEYLALCGAAGLGRFALDDPKVMTRLKALASHPRWRVREGVAIALQRIGDADMDALIKVAIPWARDPNLYVRRASVAAVCEPRLLKNPKHAGQSLILVDQLIALIPLTKDRKSDAFRVLRQALGYCASVAAAASPGLGRRMMEEWLRSDDPDVRWIVKANLSKSRMAALGQAWVAAQLKNLE